MKVLLIIIICLLAAGLVALFYALRALTRRDASAASSRMDHSAASPDMPEADEATLHDMIRILEKLEKRVDVLETLLDQHTMPQAGSDAGTPSRGEAIR